MKIIPAIDIIENKPVRLYQGDYNKKTVVGTSVLDIAKQFENEGAKYLHVVDLDGAKSGSLINNELILDIVKTTNLKVDVGGGIRSMNTIDYYLNNGVDKITLGTAAIQDKELLLSAIEKYGDRIIVGVDCRNEMLCVSGWTNEENVHYLDFVKDLIGINVKTIIFTDISKDGTLEGPNYKMLEKLRKLYPYEIIASGGIKDISHIEELVRMNIDGAITGKAMYEKTLSLKEAIKVGG
ncbi:MAG: 1-(5-phosphoribosyl)-5-[(5-phosphoribosylamino)methylideneamino]imidazole-4-carboxamide isomerase [Erysipelotrichaceae bacterium]|nr:1-(5-phosphoribosyl)-5-[(5-phosphoribosylamino)methylideneamino]imidazole-4-carboxamide isomerase [Erysipelotrichaceae bacterium]